jgi:hypothetical protein
MAKDDQALIVIESLDLQTVFTMTGIDSVIAHIEQQVSEFVPDMTTAAGRKEIASMAYKVARSKTLIDKAGESLTTDWKKKAKEVDVVRKKAWDKLEQIQAEVRSSLTEWEKAEEARVATHQENMKKIKELGELKPHDLEGLTSIMFQIDSFNIDTSWQEFMAAGLQAQQTARNLLKTHRTVLEQEIEITRLRKEAEENARAAREKQIAEEAALKAKQQAELAAKLEADRIAKETAEKELAQKMQVERLEREKIAAENKARYEKEQADLRVKQATEAERQRVLTAQRTADMAQQMREADLEHKKKIHHGVMSGIKAAIGCSDDHAKSLVIAIAKGQVPNVTIKY